MCRTPQPEVHPPKRRSSAIPIPRQLKGRRLAGSKALPMEREVSFVLLDVRGPGAARKERAARTFSSRHAPS
jgi:hypothetical protein